MRPYVLRLGLLLALASAAPLASAQTTPTDPSPDASVAVLEERIRGLEKRLEDQRAERIAFAESRRAEVEAKLERAESKVTNFIWTASAFLAFLAFGLTWFGYRRLMQEVGEAIEKRAGEVMDDHLTAEKIAELIRERSGPVVEAITQAIQDRTEAAEAEMRGTFEALQAQTARKLSALVERYEKQAAEHVRALSSQKDHAESITEELNLIRDIIKPDSEYWTATDWLLYGNEAQAEHRFQEALNAYVRAIQIDPDNTVAHNNRGATLSRLGRYDEALEAADRAIQIDPAYAVAHNTRGATLSRLGRYDEALEAVDQAIQIDPAYAVAHTVRGATLSRLGRYDEALEAADRAIQIDPSHFNAYTAQSVILSYLGRYDEALEAADWAIQLRPNAASAHYLRARASTLRGDFESAGAAAQIALDKAADLPDAPYRTAVAAYVGAVADISAGDDPRVMRDTLVRALAEPFVESLTWAIYDEPLSENAEVQAAIDELGALLRQHDADHGPGGADAAEPNPAA